MDGSFGTTSVVRNSGCCPRKPRPKRSRIRNGPSTRLAISRGCRSTPTISLVKKPKVRMAPWNRSLNRCHMTLLHQQHEDFVEIRPVLLDLLDLSAAISQGGENPRDRRAGIVDRELEPAPAALVVVDTADLLDGQAVKRPEQLDVALAQVACQHLDDLPADGLPANLLRRAARDELAAAEEGHIVAVLRLGDVLAGDEDRSALVAQLPEVVPGLGAQDRV